MLAVRLPPDIETRLEALAKSTGRSKSFYVRAAILEHLDDLEDIFLAEERLTRLQSGETKAIPLEDIVRDYGLAD